MEEQEEKKKFDFSKTRFYLIALIFILVGLLINKKLFIMSMFVLLTFVGKIVRGQFGNSMIMFDPLVFFSILLMKFWGFSSLFLFLFLTVFLADAIAGNFTAGSFLNYFLFHICPLIGITLFGNLSMMVYGNFSAILYSAVYVPIRVKFLGGDPVQTMVKAVTNIVFVYLYIAFLGPIFEILM